MAQLLSYQYRQSEYLVVPAKMIEPSCDITNILGFRPGPTQTRLYSYRSRLKAGNFRFKNKKDCTSPVAKTKALTGFAVTAKLICVFVFAYAKCWYSHEAAQMECGSCSYPR